MKEIGGGRRQGGTGRRWRGPTRRRDCKLEGRGRESDKVKDSKRKKIVRKERYTRKGNEKTIKRKWRRRRLRK